MARYNLLDEKWIKVFADGKIKHVSMLELFENAHLYEGLAGEMKTQDFSVLRILLAVMHTVFSRYKPDGSEYGYFSIDPKTMRQLDEIDEDDVSEYAEDLYDTWFSLWEAGKFPEIIGTYLNTWRDRFFLYNETNAFMQVSKKEIIDRAGGGTLIKGKNINRLISESSNKVALFSPAEEGKGNKDLLTNEEVTRWLITYQGYCGTGEKRKVDRTDLTCSKGWNYDLGGIYLEGNNLFQTLMINCTLAYTEQRNLQHIQTPAWERTSTENIDLYFSGLTNNVASLYTAWSRAIYIDPDHDEKTPFSFSVGKLPEISHADQFLEPMTCWRYNDSGINKEQYTPRKHRQGESMWRNFGVVMGIGQSEKGSKHHRAGVLEWLDDVHQKAEESGMRFLKKQITVCAISMQDDGNATSWAPVDEVYDELQFRELILTDIEPEGWMERINGVVDWSRRMTSGALRKLLFDVNEIRGKDPKDTEWINNQIELFYYQVDLPFRNWLTGIDPEDNKDDAVRSWKEVFERLIKEFGERVIHEGNYRDYKGIEKEYAGKKYIKNNATVYHDFLKNISKLK